MAQDHVRDSGTGRGTYLSMTDGRAGSVSDSPILEGGRELLLY